MLEEDRVIPFHFSKAPRRGREMPHFESHWNMDYLRETKGRLEGPQELRRHRAETLPKKARQESPWRQLYEKSHRLDLSLTEILVPSPPPAGNQSPEISLLPNWGELSFEMEKRKK